MNEFFTIFFNKEFLKPFLSLMVAGVLLILFVVYSNLYIRNNTEISTESYLTLRRLAENNPELKPVLTEMMTDGMITFGELDTINLASKARTRIAAREILKNQLEVN